MHVVMVARINKTLRTADRDIAKDVIMGDQDRVATAVRMYSVRGRVVWALRPRIGVLGM